jgi:hypothetical protein
LNVDNTSLSFHKGEYFMLFSEDLYWLYGYNKNNITDSCRFNYISYMDYDAINDH